MKTNAKQLAAARRAMEVIAVREGISVEEVRREISLAMDWPLLRHQQVRQKKAVLHPVCDFHDSRSFQHQIVSLYLHHSGFGRPLQKTALSVPA